MQLNYYNLEPTHKELKYVLRHGYERLVEDKDLIPNPIEINC